MKLKEIVEALSLEPINVSNIDRDVVGAYTGDLLSWVMTRLDADSLWVTIMNNVNIVAVASLADASAIVLTEQAEIPDDVIEKAKAQDVNIFRTTKSSFEISYLIGQMLYG